LVLDLGEVKTQNKFGINVKSQKIKYTLSRIFYPETAYFGGVNETINETEKAQLKYMIKNLLALNTFA
jgi:hypothetical protein